MSKKKRNTTAKIDKTTNVKTPPTNQNRKSDKTMKKTKSNESTDALKPIKDSSAKKLKIENGKKRLPLMSTKIVQTPLKEET